MSAHFTRAACWEPEQLTCFLLDGVAGRRELEGNTPITLGQSHVDALAPTRAGTCDRMERGRKGKLPNSSCRDREKKGDVPNCSGGQRAEVTQCTANATTPGGKTLRLIRFYSNGTKPGNSTSCLRLAPLCCPDKLGKD